MSIFDTFLATYPVGSKIDTDNFPPSQPYQCFDAGLAYIRMVANNPTLYIKCASTGYVKDWYNDFATNGLSQWFDRLPWNVQGQRGDIAIYGNAPATPDSHVAMLLADNGATEQLYGQNQPSPFTTVLNLTSNGLLGYLRPKTTTTTQGADMSATDTIKSMYLRLLGRPADDGGLSTYTAAAVSKDKGWEFVYNDLKNSDEGQKDWAWRNPDAVRALEQSLATEKQKSTGLAANVADLTSKLSAANTKASDLQKDNDALRAQIAAQGTGDAGVKPTDPITTDYSWVDKLQQWLRGVFK